MTAASAVCDYCHALVAADQVFEPFPGGPYRRCRDTAACTRRQNRAFDPTLVPDEDLPVPPAASSPPGAACAICGAPGPGLYERLRGQWACLDRTACEARSVEALYLTAHADSSPDRLISAADMWALSSSAPPQVPPERTPLSPEEMARLAAQEAMGRKRNAGQPSPDEMVASAARAALGRG